MEPAGSCVTWTSEARPKAENGEVRVKRRLGKFIRRSCRSLTRMMSSRSLSSVLRLPAFSVLAELPSLPAAAGVSSSAESCQDLLPDPQFRVLTRNSAFHFPILFLRN